MKKLDIGCGRSKTPGATGMDSAAVPGVDVVHDLLNFPYPFEDGSFDAVIASHVLEHFEFGDMLKILREIHRVLKPEGILTISVPHAFSISAFAPQHRTFFTFEYFDQFCSGHTFSYYTDYGKKWAIEKRWASVNIVSDHHHPASAKKEWVIRLQNFIGKCISWFARRDPWMNVADFLVRYFPLWLVSIHWKLKKVPD